MPNHTTGNDDSHIEEAEKHASESVDHFERLKDIIEDLDSKLTDAVEATDALKQELSEAGERIAELEKELREAQP